MYSARILLDSLHPSGKSRLTTFLVSYPRCVLAEVYTHKTVFDGGSFDMYDRTFPTEICKNTSSARAIPVTKYAEMADYIPAFSGNQPGMQGKEISEDVMEIAERTWCYARESARIHSLNMAAIGIHKQHSNRLLDPFVWVTQVLTSFWWDNFFTLRTDSAADPAIQTIAKLMYLRYIDSNPFQLPNHYKSWHLPFYGIHYQDPDEVYVNEDNYGSLPYPFVKSVCSCAWVSYTNPEHDHSADAMARTLRRLVTSRPVHASPFEHQYYPIECDNHGKFGYWGSLRKKLDFESVENFSPPKEEVDKWREDLRAMGIS